MNDITEQAFDVIVERLEKDGCNIYYHPFNKLHNHKSEIIQGLEILDKVHHYSKMFPENQLLKDLMLK